jgi:hypothetical protein
MQVFLDAAFDWAERRDVPMRAWRDDDNVWHVTVELRDLRGWFSWSLPAPPRRARETTEEFEARIGQALETACVRARSERFRIGNRKPETGSLKSEVGSLRSEAMNHSDFRLPISDF